MNWYPWGDEAFADARRLGRPVFLSVGYSTCHWCHVMEGESFEDEEIAAFLNAHYIPVKVDREERPDVDAIYMSAVQALTGPGGWPMSVWLTPDREPFFGGTYFPPRDGARGARFGFLTVLREIARTYAEDPDRVRRATGSLTEAVKQQMEGRRPRPVRAARAGPRTHPGRGRDLQAAVRSRPRRPAAGAEVPLQHPRAPAAARAPPHRRRRSLQMATRTLEKMAAGGLYDQVGGGFHRYSTDERWLVPHFEKMLYDNALLAVAYAEAWQVTRRPDFARVLRETLDYLLREMTSPEGAFYSATDADSEGEEGRFFVWSASEMRDVLGAAAEAFMRYYDVTEGGNFEGHNILKCRAGPTSGSTPGSPAPGRSCTRRAPAACPPCATTRSWPPGTAWRSPPSPWRPGAGRASLPAGGCPGRGLPADPHAPRRPHSPGLEGRTGRAAGCPGLPRGPGLRGRGPAGSVREHLRS